MEAKKKLLARLIRIALEEDRVTDDITTNSLLAHDRQAKAHVMAKAGGVISGIVPFCSVFSTVDRMMGFTIIAGDGSPVKPGDVVAEVRGRESSILRAERTALNFLQHLSGVATLTRRFVEKIDNLPVTLLDTRKTTPGMRYLEKEAVVHGGGHNHRLHLGDMALVKENHIEMAGGIAHAVTAIRKECPGKKIEVEVKNLQELEEALRLGVEMVMLDNFPPDLARKAVQINGGRAKLELSGNVTLDNIREKAETGVDFISAGALTHSSISLDLSLLLERE